MVQYMHTPWRDRAELLKVRRQLYPSTPTDATIPSSSIITTTATTTTTTAKDAEQERDQRRAVSRVAMWMQRGSCPHMVESTGLLTAAILDDIHETRSGSNSSSAVRLAYSAAFSRFVTGLLDSHQDKLQKQSMYSIAKTIGLPATFVELRHQCTHEQLPSLLKLRSAASKSLAWIWDYYWKHLAEHEHHEARDGSGTEACRELLLGYLESDDETRRKTLLRRLDQWDEAMILQTLWEIGDSAENPRVLLQSLRMTRRILEGKEQVASPEKDGDSKTAKDMGAVKSDISRVRSELEAMESAQIIQAVDQKVDTQASRAGWSRYPGSWKPKPIGVV